MEGLLENETVPNPLNVHIWLQNWQKSAVNFIEVQPWASAHSRLVTAASAQNLSVHQIQGLWRQKSHNLQGFTQWHIHSVRSRQWFSSTVQCLMLDQWLVCRKQETSICCMSLDMDAEMFTFDWCLVLCIYFRTLKLRLAFATQSSSWQQQQHALRERHSVMSNVKVIHANVTPNIFTQHGHQPIFHFVWLLFTVLLIMTVARAGPFTSYQLSVSHPRLESWYMRAAK